MNTAPPTTWIPLFTTAEPYHMHTSYLSPASTIASDSSYSYTSMSPRQETHAPVRRPGKPKRSPTTPEPARNEALTWITGVTPGELKSKENMTIIRKKAMDHHLTEKKKDGDSGASADRSRLNSEVSDVTPSSIGSRDHGHSTNRTVSVSRRTKLSRTRSPESTNHSQTQIARSFGSVLPQASIVRPMRVGVDLPYDGFVPPPLASIGEALDPFRSMFQATHPRVSVENLKFHCSRYFGTYGLGKHWIPTCLDHPHTFLSTLCLASAHHDVVMGRSMESLETAALRQEIIHLVGRNLLDPEKSLADHNIVAVIQLIIGEVIGRAEAGLVWHEAGIEQMIEQRGGLNQLGMNGRLASSVSWVNMASAILREAKPRTIYIDYCASKSSKTYLPTTTVPESPIYCPQSKYVTVKRSKSCKQETLNLLVDIKTMIDNFLDQTKQSHRNSQTPLSLYRKITSDYPSASELRKTNVLTSNDWKYEAIRITAVVLATAITDTSLLSKALTKAAARIKLPILPTLYTSSSAASRSTESLVSPFDPRHDTPITDYSISPTYNLHSTSPAMQQPGFPFDAPRPSISSSKHLSSSEHTYFPPPPTPAPSGPDALLDSLKDALDNSDLSDCWADMAGVLLWIGLVVGAASTKSDHKLLKKYFSATAIRAGIMLCFEHPEAIHSTMLRMNAVIEGLSDKDTGSVDKGDNKALGKRRRV